MIHHTVYKYLFFVLTVLLLAACGGGGLSTDATTGGSVTQGIAVDPYIVGAIFQEIEEGTGIVLQESSPSDEFGMFSFEDPLTPGSVVELVPNTGLHGGAPYEGILRRIVGTDDDVSVVISPLTTLLTNGVTPEDLVAAFNDAGLTGLTTSDLYDDPMAGLADTTTGLTDEDLELLQAAMAANAFMEVTGNFQAGMDELNDVSHFEIFSTMVNAMENLLNAQEFGTITTELANDPDVTSAPIFEDYVLAVLTQQQTIIALAQENMTNNGSFDPALVDQAVQNAMGNSFAMVKDAYSQRVPLSVAYDGETLYHDNCSACHGILVNTEVPGRTAADIQTAIDQNFGGMGSLSSLTPGEVQAIAEVLVPAQTPGPVSPSPTPVPDPTVPLDGTTLYTNNCSLCHGQVGASDIVDRSVAGIQAAIDTIGMMSSLGTLTQGEITAIAEVLVPTQTPGPVSPSPTPVPDPTVPLDGTTLYTNNCSLCHGQIGASDIVDRSVTGIQAAIDTIGMMSSLGTLTQGEITAIAEVLVPTQTPGPVSPSPTPVPDPTVPLDGTTLYTNNCSLCHGQVGASDIVDRSVTGIQTAIDTIGMMSSLGTLTQGEITAIAEVLVPTQTPGPVSPSPTPVPDPTVPLDGTTLYTNNCSLCHGQVGASDIVDRSVTGIQTAIDTIGMMSSLNTLTQEEIAAIIDVLPAAAGPVSGPDYSDCTLCHDQPPSGSSFPDTAGAHAAHVVLASIGNDCSVCHLGAAHNSQVDLAFPADFDALSGPATDNLDGTCSSVICHGGQTTPDWWTESIAVETQCTSCHTYGTSQFNSYSSGRHNKHVQDKGYSCKVCHNTVVLQNGHFNNLATPDFELSPASTIGGGSTKVGSYSNGTCSSIECHGSKSW